MLSPTTVRTMKRALSAYRLHAMGLVAECALDPSTEAAWEKEYWQEEAQGASDALAELNATLAAEEG